jgi:hypothetical protein
VVIGERSAGDSDLPGGGGLGAGSGVDLREGIKGLFSGSTADFVKYVLKLPPDGQEGQRYCAGNLAHLHSFSMEHIECSV